MLMDTGANVNAAKIRDHFPPYANYVTAVDSEGGEGCAECASGNVVKCRGKVRVNGTIAGQETSIPFRDMDIKMPISSMKKRVQGKNGFDDFILGEEAIMRNRATGKVVRLYD